MDKSTAKLIIDDRLKPMRNAMQLNQWTIDVVWGHIDGEAGGQVKGQCTADPKYMRASIELDPESHADEADLLRTLRHELLHIFHAEYQLYRRQVGHVVSDTTFDGLDEAYQQASERTVWMMEQMLDHGGDLECLIKHSLS